MKRKRSTPSAKPTRSTKSTNSTPPPPETPAWLAPGRLVVDVVLALWALVVLMNWLALPLFPALGSRIGPG